MVAVPFGLTFPLKVAVVVAIANAGRVFTVGTWGMFNEAIRVFQVTVPVVCTYSVVYQNVESLEGSTDIML